jgi:PAS domain-containing protein
LIVRVDELQKAKEVIANQIEAHLSDQELERSGKQDHFLRAIDISETTKVFTDNSGCFKSGDTLPDSKDYLNKIINSISDPIFVKDRLDRLILVNDAECKLAGRTREELIGNTDYDFFPKEQVDFFWEKDEIVFEPEKRR